MRGTKLFPVLVFFLMFAVWGCAVGLIIYVKRPGDIPVTRGRVPATQDQRIVPADVDAYMIRNLSTTGVPGAILAIVKGDQILYTAGYGHTSQGAPVKPDTPMYVASLTKSFTATAVMLLAEEGRIGLDTSVGKYLPEFILADPRSLQITVRHLLNQTSGLSVATLPSARSPPAQSLTEQIQWLKEARLASDPGKVFHYCNDNYNLLALLIERVSGMPYSKFMQVRLFEPMGMNKSYVFLATPAPDVAPGHFLLYGVPTIRETVHDFVGGAGGIVTSANDLAQWLVLNSTGGKTTGGKALLSPASVAAEHAPSVPGSDYGLGWRQETLPGGTLTVHDSGKMQTFAAHERLFPASGYAYAFVMNAGHSFNAEAASFIRGLNEIMAGRKPVIGWPFTVFGLPFGLIADHAAAILTVFVLTIGVVGSTRSRAWARRRFAEPWWRVALRLTPYLLMSIGVATLPMLMAFANRGAPVALGVIFSVWPPLVVLFVATAVSGACVVVFRVAGLLAERSAFNARVCPVSG